MTKRVLYICYLLVTVLITILTIVAISLGGTSFVVLGCAEILSFICLSLILWAPHKAKILAIPFLVGLIPLYLLLPGKGSHNPQALLEYKTVYESSSQWFAGLPERDLVHMGENWGYTQREKESLKNAGTLADSYEKISEESLFQYDASVVLDSWFFDRGHYWFLKPTKKNRPLLIFLHGSGGNFKAYQHWFVPYAQKYDIAMAFPTLGLGIWSKERLEQRFNDVIKDLQKDYQVNPEQIFICALSQGGLTGLEMLSQGNLNPRGFIAISGVPPLTREEANTLSKTPLYFIHGGKDERVPASNAKSLYERLLKNDALVKYDEYPNEGHTLIKTKTDEVVDSIFNWINSFQTR